MAHTLALELPEETYAALARFAEEQGCSIEELGADWLKARIEQLAEHPLLRLAGAFDSGQSLPDDPEELFAEQLLAELRGNEARNDE